MIHKDTTVNLISNSVIAPVSPRPSSQSYSDNLKCPKRMMCKIVKFSQDSNNVYNNHFRGREKQNTLLKGFNDHHINYLYQQFFGNFYSF